MKDPGKPFGTQLPPSLMRAWKERTQALGLAQGDTLSRSLRAWLKTPADGVVVWVSDEDDGKPHERLHTRLPVALIARVKARAARRSIRVYDAVTEAVSAWVVAARKEAPRG
jgi:hypothetical protein